MSDRPMVVLFSGGLDSRICLQWAMEQSDKVSALYIDFGHRYAKMESKRAVEIARGLNVPMYFRVMELADLEQEDAYIPLRNLYLLQLATIYGDDIVFGMLYNETAPDKNPSFIRNMQQLLTSQFQSKEFYEKSRKIRILTPFAYNTKTEALRWFLQSGDDREEQARATVSCYSSEGKCGRCMSCLNRWVAWTCNRLEPEEYKYPPYEWAVEKFVGGKKKRQNLLSLPAVWFKRKYVLELLQAFGTIVHDPLTVAWQVYRQHSVEPFRKALDGATD